MANFGNHSGRAWNSTASVKTGFISLLILCIALRAWAWTIYEPIRAPDTGTYVSLADQIAAWDFSDYDGTRTPGYPLFLVLAGKDPYFLWLLQSVLGLGSSLILFLFVLELSRNSWLALVAGLVHSASLNLLFFEAVLLTETISAFLLVLSVFLFWRLLVQQRLLPAISLGVVAAMVGLTHPLFSFLGLLYLLLTFVLAIKESRLRLSLVVLLVSVLPIAGWVAWNKTRLDFAGITTFTGFNLSNHSGAFMELAPSSLIRDIYLKHRSEKVATTGTHSMTIFRARKEIQRETGLSTPEISRELTRISIRLFIQHPRLYLRSVVAQWIGFWTVPNPWQLDRVKGDITELLERVWRVQQWFLRLINLTFLALSVGLSLVCVFGRTSGVPNARVVFALSTVVLVTSLVQALFEYGEARYSIPTQSLVGCAVLLYSHALVSNRARNTQTGTTGDAQPAPQVEITNEKSGPDVHAGASFTGVARVNGDPG